MSKPPRIGDDVLVTVRCTCPEGHDKTAVATCLGRLESGALIFSFGDGAETWLAAHTPEGWLETATRDLIDIKVLVRR
jgi:hypothetical protein